MSSSPWRLVCTAALLVAAFGAGAQQQTSTSFAAPLTSTPGDPVRGRLIVRDASRATCLICHAMPIPEEPDHGNIGPPLHGIASRATAAQLRQRLVDATTFNPATVMPPYFRSDGLHRVLERHRGRTIYTAQDVEDVLAYLLTLTR